MNDPIKYAPKKVNCTNIDWYRLSSNIFLRKGIRMSLSTVINPHIKKSDVKTINAEVYF